MMILDEKAVNAVMHALLLAQHDLSFLHGARITDIPDDSVTWRIDNSETTQAITEAILILDASDDNHNQDCS